jgi:hypothetical protein
LVVGTGEKVAVSDAGEDGMMMVVGISTGTELETGSSVVDAV